MFRENNVCIFIKYFVIFFPRRYEDALVDIQEAVRLVPHGNSDIRHVLFRLKDDIQNKLALDQSALKQDIAGPSYL